MADISPAAWRHWRLTRDGGGIGWLCFDQQDAGANTLSTDTLGELEGIIGHLAGTDWSGLVIHSGKPGSFIVGADIREFPRLVSAEQAFGLVRRGQQLMDRITALPFPTVAVLNGHALGGGLELALACTARIALAGTERVFGLPEIQLGLHPGFGGTIRATRLLGVRRAMTLMLTGKAWRPGESLAAGLVDEVVPEDQWRAAAVRRLQAKPPRRYAPLLDRLLALGPVRPFIARRLLRQAARKAPPRHYPAPGALIDLWRRFGGAPVPAAYEAEARSFAQLALTATSRNLVRVYFLQERLKKLGREGPQVRRVHVVGAGVMGGDIAAWCALRGLEVTLQDREMKYIQPALDRAAELFDKRAKDPAGARAARDRLRADVPGAGAAGADLVIEAVFEDRDVKRRLYEELEPQLRPETLIATNTSSIPLEELGTGLRDPGRLIGLHFFNPVAQLPLVEVVQAQASSPAAVTAGMAFVRQIGKLPLPCRSQPGFLVNRILAPYMDEAMRLMREGVPPAEIDHAATVFGMPMGPVELADSVGLDVALHVARILSPVLKREVAPELAELVDRGHLGRKSGQGFYTYREGRPVRPGLSDGACRPDAQERLILALLNEAADCLHEGIVADGDLVDAGVIFGTGFAPFRGGPLAHARAEGVDSVVARLTALAETHGPRFRPSPGWDRLRG